MMLINYMTGLVIQRDRGCTDVWGLYGLGRVQMLGGIWMFWGSMDIVGHIDIGYMDTMGV